MPGQRKLIPIYTSNGIIGAYLVYPYVYNPDGEWTGWVNAEREVYSVHGHYAGILTQEPRIIRQREVSYEKKRQQPPSPPARIRPPAHTPLAPSMPELTNSQIDILEDPLQFLPPLDFGELRDDLD